MKLLRDLVSDWELDEMREELGRGEEPELVAFWHDVPVQLVRDYRSHMKGGSCRRWTDAETDFVRDNYPAHGKGWPGWAMLDRTWDAIRGYACKIGVRRRIERFRRLNMIALI